MKKLFVFLALFAVILCGCKQKNAAAQPRVVTAVDIYCRHKDKEFSRHYRENEKLEAVLLYLRLLKPERAFVAQAQPSSDDLYEIHVHLSDGQTRLYKQRDHRYFWRSNTGWQTIPAQQAAGLYALLRHYQSDL